MSKDESLSTEPYKGVRDFYPEDYAKLSGIFNHVRKTLSLYGYEEYNASPLERSELYHSKGNDEIINEQTYTFTDRGDRSVTLRPEMTPSLARMVAAKRRDLTFPLRWFSIGNRFRYERPQRGRLREFYQIDVDLLGLPEGEADLEILALAHEVLSSFEATEDEFTIRINSRGLLSAACSAAGYDTKETAREYLRLLDKKDKMPAEEYIKGLEGHADPLALIEEASDSAIREEKEKLLALVDAARARGIGNITFDPSVARGFDYYTGMVFEVFDTDEANARALFGGGRYDGLVSLFGGDPVPAVGFGIGEVTLADFLETHNHEASTDALHPELFIATPESEDMPQAQTLAKGLRGAGIRVLVNLRDKGVGDQVQEAVKRNIPFFLVYGADERDSSVVRIKTLAKTTEEELPVSGIADFVRHHRA